MNRPAIRAALALLLTVLLCAGANIAACFIDTQQMRQNAAQGVTMLGEQGGIPQLIGGFKAAQLDNYTSVLILKTAAYTGEETLMQRAFGGTRTDMPAAEGQSTWEAYCTYADGSLSPTGGLTYSRYWHGYTLPLRILLCVMNVSNIQMFLLAVRMLAPIFEVAETIRDLTGLSSAVTAPLFKVTAIGLIGRIAAGVCSDAGEHALENAVELTASILAVYAALPLLTAVLDLLQEMLGG